MDYIKHFFAAQASTGKQGVLGPTKIYLAVQPSSGDVDNSQPPPLAPVQQNPIHTATTVTTQPKTVINQVQTSPGAVQANATVQQVCNMNPMKPKPKVIVQPVNQALYT